MNVILASRRLKTSDRRDHVYAFLGSPLARRKNGSLIVEPDYDKKNDAENVFVEVAIALLANEREAPWVLLYVDPTCEDDLQAVHLPSWAPRWDSWEHKGNGECEYWYRAGGEIKLFKPKVHDTYHLHFDGFLFDHIQWTSDLIQMDRFLLSLAQPPSQYPGKVLVDELWAALVAIVGCTDREFHDGFLLALVRAFPFAKGLFSINMDELRADFRAYQTRIRSPSRDRVSHSDLLEDGNPWGMEFNLLNLENKRFFFRKTGRLGVAPSFSRPGDVCCIAFGLANPIILRPSTSNPNHYNLVGGAYINDVMNGELLENLDISDLKTETIRLA